MLIYAFDPGSKVTGYAILDRALMGAVDEGSTNDRWAAAAAGILDAGVIPGSSSKYLDVRLCRLHRDVIGLIRAGIRHHVEKVGPLSPEGAGELHAVVEQPAWAGTNNRRRNPQAVAGLNRWIGALSMSLAVSDVNRVELFKARKVTKQRRRLAALAAIRQAGGPAPPEDQADVWDALYLGLDWIVSRNLNGGKDG